MTQRVVWAVDVLASVVSLARIAEPEGGGVSAKPAIGVVDFPSAVNDHTPLTNWERSSAVADEVVAKITAGGVPTLVVFSKQQWGALLPVSVRTRDGQSRTTPTDHTAARRIMLQALIEDRLHQLGVPVGEFPYPTALRWFHDGASATYGKDASKPMSLLSDAVTQQWGITQPVIPVEKKKIVESRTEVETVEVRAVFRVQVVMLAAVGAMSVGIETTVPVTEERLKIAAGVGNKSVQFPKNRRCPTDLDMWDELRRRPNILEVAR